MNQSTIELVERKKARAEIKALEDQRLMDVVESSKFIQDTASDLTAKEMKVLYVLFSQLPPHATSLDEPIIIPIGLLLDILGLSHGGKNYNSLKQNLLAISSKKWWVTTAITEGEENHTKESLMGYIDTIDIIDRSIARVKLSNSLAPFFTDLKKSFTRYPTEILLCLRSNKFIIEFFRWASSVAYLGEVKIKVDELRRILDLKDSYSQYRDLKSKIINVAIEEINKYGVFEMTFRELKAGRNVDQLLFYFAQKEPTERLLAHRNCMEKLGYPESMKFEGLKF